MQKRKILILQFHKIDLMVLVAKTCCPKTYVFSSKHFCTLEDLKRSFIVLKY